MQISDLKLAIKIFLTPRSKKKYCVKCNKWFIPYARELRDSSKGSVGDYFCIKCFKKEMEKTMTVTPFNGMFDRPSRGTNWDIKWNIRRYKK